MTPYQSILHYCGNLRYLSGFCPLNHMGGPLVGSEIGWLIKTKHYKYEYKPTTDSVLFKTDPFVKHSSSLSNSIECTNAFYIVYNSLVLSGYLQ